MCSLQQCCGEVYYCRKDSLHFTMTAKISEVVLWRISEHLWVKCSLSKMNLAGRKKKHLFFFFFHHRENKMFLIEFFEQLCVRLGFVFGKELHELIRLRSSLVCVRLIFSHIFSSYRFCFALAFKWHWMCVHFVMNKIKNLLKAQCTI